MLAEAESLVRALDAFELVGAEIAPLARIRAGTLFGSGKLAEIGARITDLAVDVVVINGPVSPVQQRNLERAWKVKVLDRTGLILEIFGARARTREGALQVELAHLSYQRSRLVRSWTHLERQRGGFGFLGGPGETQIEADRRALDEQIARLGRQIAEIQRTRRLHRTGRARRGFATVALVGYTNAGKSTLFNRLTGESVMARDMLFATLDTTLRRITLPGGTPVILSDTVGFISDLPTQLVSAFRATLEEIAEADLVVHVRDITHPESAAQAESVHAVLSDLDLPEGLTAAMIEFRNKLDLAPEMADPGRVERHGEGRIVWGSAGTGAGVDALLQQIEAALAQRRIAERLHLGYDQGAALAWMHRHRLLVERHAGDGGIAVEVLWSPAERARFSRSFPEILPG
ncbi:MAG: GTPase HflX [Paracoccaceae bacterium]|nr:MAG: GTPase HflX [Paracoccaceae bacterium]